MLLDPGVQKQIVAEAPATAGTTVQEFSIQSDALLVTLWATAVSAALDVSVYALVNNREVLLLSFPTLNAPTPVVLVRHTAVIPQTIRVRATYTGACSYEIYARAVEEGASDAASISVDFAPLIDAITVTNPQISTVSLPTAATEVPFALPANTKRFLVQARRSTPNPELRLSYTSGGNYVTIAPNCFYSEGDLDSPTITLYLTSSLSGQVAEIVSWT